MGIYNTNAYSPLGAIQAGIANVNEKNRIKDNYWKNWGNTWSNFATDMGKLAGRTIDGISAAESDPDQAELEKLEEELREAEIEQKYNEQVEQRKAFDQWASGVDRLKHYQEGQYRDYRPLPDMDGYHPYQERRYPDYSDYHPTTDMNDYHPIQGNPLFGMEEFYRRGGGVY